MNVLKLFLSATWGNKKDKIFLAYFQQTLVQKIVTQKAKDF